jgi:cytidine deaminase
MNAETPDQLMTDDDLIQAARDAMDNAYAPYSRFHVGSAVLTRGGVIFTGVNVENASYGLTVCAERVAVFKAVSEGRQDITRVAIVSSSGKHTYPCGACRQVLNEFGKDIKIVLGDARGNTISVPLSGLLPHSFGRESLG